jgi:hypothetical protein
MTFTIEALVTIAGILISFVGYVAWASIRIGSLQNQVENNKTELGKQNAAIENVKRDLAGNYVHNRVLDQILEQLSDIKRSLDKLST